jgi:hypothetical protein
MRYPMRDEWRKRRKRPWFAFFDRAENMKTVVTIRFKEGITSLSSELEELSCPAPS